MAEYFYKNVSRENPRDVHDCLKQLQLSFQNGDEDKAMQLAKQLANWRVKCNIEIDHNYTGNETGSNFSRSSSPDPYIGGWCCPRCTYVNIRNRPGCEMCTHPRPGDSEDSDQDEIPEIMIQQQEVQQNYNPSLRRNSSKILEELVKLDNEPIIRNDEKFECPICFTEIEIGQGIKVRECLHTVCEQCLIEHISKSEKAHVDCPYRDNDYSCDYNLQDREIKALVSPEIYEKYQQRSVKAAESSNPDSFHCKTANCNGWCVCDDDANEFLCPVCKMINCITCRAIHENSSCIEYQEKLKHEASYNEDARKTQQALEDMILSGDAINCPQCQVVIMKKGGCDWIQCTACRFEICWVTKGPRWGPGGRGDTSGGCRCRVNGLDQICHPNCKNCH